MKHELSFVPVTATNAAIYLQTGVESYNQHYTYLWEKEDPTPYLDTSFSPGMVKKELKDGNIAHFIIRDPQGPVGIIKLVKDCAVAAYSPKEALLLEKIYMLKSHAGKGLGGQCLCFVEEYARKLQKQIVWLCAMKKGRALQFYLRNGFDTVDEINHWSEKVLKEHRAMLILTKGL